MSYQYVQYEVEERIATITMNRPERRNAQGTQMLDELNDAVKRASSDNDVNVLVFSGAGEHFSAGHDLKEGETRKDLTPDERWDYENEKYLGYALNIRNCSKPTIARVDGACMAAAFMVANMCDLIVASDRAFFSDPVVHTMAVAGVEVLVHPWRMGNRRARQFLFTGERIDAVEAERLGMVNYVTTPSELDGITYNLAQRIAAAPPHAIKIVKRSLNQTEDIMGYTNAVEAHFSSHVLTHFTAEAMEMKSGSGYSSFIGRGKSHSNASEQL